MKEDTEGRTINIQDKCLDPINFYYDEFDTTPTNIIIFDILHPKEIERGNNNYLIYPGCLADQPNYKMKFNFAAATFLKCLRKNFDIFQFPATEKVCVKMEVKRTKYFLELKNITKINNHYHTTK